MIALDSSSIIAFLSGDDGADVRAVEAALRFRQGVFPPVVVTELVSAAEDKIVLLISAVPQLDISGGYWQRAGRLRSQLLRRGFKARLADTLIAQSCLDHDVALITRDKDFRHFAAYASLRLH